MLRLGLGTRLVGMPIRGIPRTGTRQLVVRNRQFHLSSLRRNAQKATESATKSAPGPEPKKRLSLRELTKKYGWAAAGVYFGLSALDFPICFAVVHSMGKDRVQELERKVKGWFGFSTDDKHLATGVADENGDDAGATASPAAATDSKEGESDNNWSVLLTELGIAYAIHKSFIFLRVPATAAITPWAVKTLRRWGFKIGSGSGTAASASVAAKPDFGTSPTQRQKWTSWFF